jgi:DNA polymerase III subunit delta'
LRFSDIYGFESLKSTLVESVKKDHLAHALMFSGKEGCPNLALALAFAQFVNCESPLENDSCGQCASCSKTEKLIHPDLMTVFPSYSAAGKEGEAVKAIQTKAFREKIIQNSYLNFEDWSKSIDADKKQCIISVEEGRNIARYISMKAFEAKYKIVLIWLPELMNQSCANSILKILEEPPQKTLYLLVTNDFEKNIITILSRTQMVHVPLFKEKDIEKYLGDKHFIPSKQALQISKFSDGSLREALRLTKQEVDTNATWFVDWMRISYKAEVPSMMIRSEEFAKFSRAEQISTLKHGLEIAREIMLNNNSLDQLKRVSEEDAKFLEGFSKVFDSEKLEKYVHLFTQAMFHIERNLNVKIVFLDLSLSLAKILRKK